MDKVKQRVPTLFLLSLLNVLLLALGHAYSIPVLLWIALLSISLTVLVSPKQEFLALMLFYLPWSPVLKTEPNSFTLVSLVAPLVFLAVLWQGYRSEVRYKAGNLIVALFFTAFTLLVKMFNELSLQTAYLFFILMLFFLPLYVSLYQYKLRFGQCVLFLTGGVLSACLAATLLMNYPHMLPYINLERSEQIGLNRLCGFYGDPNYYSAQILVAIAALLILLAKTTQLRHLVLQVAAILGLVYFGLLSVSKMFILSLSGLVVVWIVNFLIERRRITAKVGLLLAVMALAGLVLSTQLFAEQINFYLMRFGRVTGVNTLTTGRNTLWGVYLGYLLDHPDKLIFGIGLSEDQVRILLHTNNAHNTLIEILYQLGMIGGLTLLCWWRMVSGEVKSKLSLNFANKVYLLMIACAVFLPWLVLDILNFREFFYFTLLFMLTKNYLTETKTVKGEMAPEKAVEVSAG